MSDARTESEMALTTCPECEHQVSESAATCPNCGHPFQEVASPSQANHSNPVSGPLIAALFAAGAIVVGSLLPWLSVTTIFGSLSVNGTDGDGILTLIAGAVIAALAGMAFAKKSASRLTGILIIGLGAVSGLIAFNIFLNFADSVDLADSGVLSTIGGGLWLVILGSAVAVGAGVSVVTGVSREPDQEAKPWVGIAVGAAVAVVLVVALATLATQSAGSDVAKTFSEISSGLAP